MNLRNGRSTPILGEGEHVQRELRRVEERRHNVVNAIGHTSGKAVVTLVEELDRLEQEGKTLPARLEQWLFMQDCAVTDDGLLQMLTDQRDRLIHGPPQEQKGVGQLFVERVTVTTETITAKYIIKHPGYRMTVHLNGGR